MRATSDQESCLSTSVAEQRLKKEVERSRRISSSFPLSLSLSLLLLLLPFPSRELKCHKTAYVMRIPAPASALFPLSPSVSLPLVSNPRFLSVLTERKSSIQSNKSSTLEVSRERIGMKGSSLVSSRSNKDKRGEEQETHAKVLCLTHTWTEKEREREAVDPVNRTRGDAE